MSYPVFSKPPYGGSMRAFQSRARSAGLRGNGGGWLFPAGQAVQGWAALERWVARYAELARREPNLAEILEGRRVGVPTLNRRRAAELAVGLSIRGPVSWRE